MCKENTSFDMLKVQHRLLFFSLFYKDKPQFYEQKLNSSREKKQNTRSLPRSSIIGNKIYRFLSNMKSKTTPSMFIIILKYIYIYIYKLIERLRSSLNSYNLHV